ncbi:MAG: DUF721 domain-containing protein [Fibrobacterota bacterium]
MNKRKKIYTVGELIDSVMENIGRANKSQNIYILSTIQSEWENICGEKIAKVSSPRFLKNNVLTIHVKNALWRSELFYIKNDLIQNINKYVGDTHVINIILK